MLLLLSSCSRGIDPDKLDFISEFNDKGLALAGMDDVAFVVNRDYEPVTPRFNLVNESSGYYIGYNGTGKDVVMNSSYEPVDSAEAYLSDVTSAALIWFSDENGHICAKNLRTGSVVFDETDVEFMESTESGSVLLRRCGAHYIMPLRHISRKPVFDYMLVGRDGRILAPWGKYKYIDSVSNGLARFTNSATCYRVGMDKGYEFESTERYRDPRFGYIDENGRIAIPERYENCDAFDFEGHARADEVYGDSQPNIIIDKSGNIVGRYRPVKGGLY